MSDDSQAYKERISQDAAIMVGKPVIRGTRMPVELILEWLSGNSTSRSSSRPIRDDR